jgi:hypothetical protein
LVCKPNFQFGFDILIHAPQLCLGYRLGRTITVGLLATGRRTGTRVLAPGLKRLAAHRAHHLGREAATTLVVVLVVELALTLGAAKEVTRPLLVSAIAVVHGTATVVARLRAKPVTVIPGAAGAHIVAALGPRGAFAWRILRSAIRRSGYG